MGIDAVALLRGRDLPLPSGLLLKTLDDGVLVYTLARFSADPEVLAVALRGRIGDALDAHHDPRGVFVVPDVAEPRARTYDGVIDEIGEAGVWIPIVAAGHVPASMAAAAEGSFAQAMGQVLGALDGETMAALQRAIMTGDASALAAAQARLIAAVGGEAQMEALGEKLAKAAGAEAPNAVEEMQKRLAATFPVDPKLDLDALREKIEGGGPKKP